MKRRDALLTGLFGTGYIGLKAVATGLPAWFLLDPRKATAQSLQCQLTNQANAQYLIVSTNFNGDPINCNCPGSYETADAVHPDDAQMAATAVSLGGKSYNAESRPSPEADQLYAELHDAALRADLDLFRRPTWEAYLATAEVEARFAALRERLIEESLAHFAALGHDVVARLGRMHSRARRLARRGLAVRVRTGAGSFFPEQVLKRRALFDLPIREEDRMRAYVDRFLRLVPAWGANGGRGPAMPPRRVLQALRGERLATVCERFDAAARASRSLPELADLLRLLEAA